LLPESAAKVEEQRRRKHMGTIFILLGSLVGFAVAVISVATGALPLLSGLALWIASGPISALAFVFLVPALRALHRMGPHRNLA
jgi:hypothetical protein